jgi:hypothetical protein
MNSRLVTWAVRKAWHFIERAKREARRRPLAAITQNIVDDSSLNIINAGKTARTTGFSPRVDGVVGGAVYNTKPFIGILSSTRRACAARDCRGWRHGEGIVGLLLGNAHGRRGWNLGAGHASARRSLGQYPLQGEWRLAPMEQGSEELHGWGVWSREARIWAFPSRAGKSRGGRRHGRGRAELLAADGWRARGRRLGKMAARGRSQPWKNHRAERSSPMPGDRRHGETRACREGHHDLLPCARWSLGKGDAMAATEGIGQALPHSCAQLVSM